MGKEESPACHINSPLNKNLGCYLKLNFKKCFIKQPSFLPNWEAIRQASKSFYIPKELHD